MALSSTGTNDRLTELRYVTVILRVTMDGPGRLRHGEIVDVEGRVRERFDTWRDLSRCLRSAIAEGAFQSTPFTELPHA